jgi:phosphatidylserine/phosphatidylglycerophosphate/cardiolipin synthase-like enzyme
MPGFISPLTVLSGDWTFTDVDVTVPPGLRYEGYLLRALHAARTDPVAVVLPALGVPRSAIDSAGRTWVELQTIPFPIRRVVSRVPFGLPTFYLVFEPGAAVTAFVADAVGPQGSVVATVPEVRIAVAGQDRLPRDPVLWSAQLATALVDGGGDVTAWQPFVDAITAALAPAGAEPLLVVDTVGAPFVGDLRLVETAGARRSFVIALTAADRGDVAPALRRADPAIASPWSLANPRLEAASPDADLQFAALDDGEHAAGGLAVSPARRRIIVTDLHDWMAPQFIVGGDLARLTRGNRIDFFHNGIEYFDAWFRLLHRASRDPTGALHLAGWVMFNSQLTTQREGEPADLPQRLEDVARLFATPGGGSRARFLPSHFFDIDPDAETEAYVIALVLLIVLLGYLVISYAVDQSKVPPQSWLGAIMAGAAALGGGGALIETDLAELEPTRSTREVLNEVAPGTCAYSPHPALLADNPVAGGFGTDDIFELLPDHVGIQHQKFSIVFDGTMHHGFCGGIDCVHQQLDDAHHLLGAPFHDLQARVFGPAVRDLALTFDQRWRRDAALPLNAFPGGPLAPAMAVPTAAALAAEVAAMPPPDGEAGEPVAVQVARTYFRPVSGGESRSLPFAPRGDMTVHETLLAAIGRARELIYIEDQYLTPPPSYRDAMVAALGRVRQMVIVVPQEADVPMVDIRRDEFLQALRAEERRLTAGMGGRLFVGYPRRHITLPSGTHQIALGRLVLGEPVEPFASTIVLGPLSRLPGLPFFVAIDGELIWVQDEDSAGVSDSDVWRRFQVKRGIDPDRGIRLVRAQPTVDDPPRPRRHEAGAAAAVVDLTGIYVHAKLMIVDDVFLSHGSTNMNRRGFFHDGELNLFVVPERLRASPANPIAGLRRRLWAELLDLPVDVAAPLVADPMNMLHLLARSPLHGNRFLEMEARPEKLTWSWAPSSDALPTALTGALFVLQTSFGDELWDAAVDPSSHVTDP